MDLVPYVNTVDDPLPFGGAFWCVTDTHLLHRNINEYEPVRQTLGAPADEVMVANWQATVAPDDVVVHLGDLVLGRRDDFAPIAHKLPGRKFLVRGNHDRRSRAWYAEHGFEVIPAFWMNYRGWRVRFTHYPDDERVFVRYPKTLNVHGHVHSKTRDDRRLLNLCPEVRGFAPERIDAVLDERVDELKR